MAARTSSSKIAKAEMSTTYGDVFAEDTTDGVPITVGVGSSKPDPSSY